jgi:signal transduction histidine kinase
VKSIRWKLILTSVLLVFIPIYLLNRYALDFFDRFTRKALEDQLISHAFIIGEEYKSLVLSNAQPAEFDRLLKTYEPIIGARLCLLATNGVVLFDSGTNSLAGADLSARREVCRAMQGRYGARATLTPDRQYMFYYVALPVKQSNDCVAIAYAFQHTAPIIGALKRMTTRQQLVSVVALLAAAAVAIVLAQTLTRRLRQLTKAAVAFAKGTAAWQTHIRGHDEIAELGGAMTAMATELKKRNQYNRDFVFTVMHELKTPLTAVKGTVEVLEEGAADKPETRQKFLANIRHEVERMIRMVSELNELTKLDVELLRGQKELVDYAQFVRQVADRLAPTFDEPHAQFRVTVPDEKIATLIAPARIEQVIANLLENAFRYTPPTGTVELRVATGPDHTVITSVHDTGRGIAPANRAKVFDRFFTTEPKDKPGHPHSGLGLAIAKTIIENHQGQLWVESEAGQGAHFFFRLPVGVHRKF